MIAVPHSFKAALAEAATKPRWLVALDEFRWTTHHRDIIIDGTTWLANGIIKSIPSLKRTRSLKAHSITFQLDALDPAIRSTLLGSNQTNKPASLSLCLLDPNDNLIGDIFVNQYKGLIDMVTLEQGSTLSIKVQSPFAKPSQTGGRLVTNAAQQDYSPGTGLQGPDRLMEKAHNTYQNLQWGGEAN